MAQTKRSQIEAEVERMRHGCGQRGCTQKEGGGGRAVRIVQGKQHEEGVTVANQTPAAEVGHLVQI